MTGEEVALLTSIIGQATGFVAGDVSSRKAYVNSKKLMDRQNQYNIDAFNRSAEYNSPLAQSQRNRQAGINPNFSDVQGSTVMQSGSVSPASVNSGADMVSAVAQLGALNLQREQLQINKKEADIKQQEANTNEMNAVTNSQKVGQEGERNQAEIGEIQARTAGQTIENQNKQSKIDADINFVNANIQHLHEQDELLKSQKDYQELVNDNYVVYISAEIYKLNSEGKFNDAKTKTEDLMRHINALNVSAQTKLYYAQKLKLENDIAVDWYKAQTDRGYLNEQVRHNMVLEKFQSSELEIKDRLTTKLGNLYDAQRKGQVYVNFGYLLEDAISFWNYKNGSYKINYDASLELLKQAKIATDNLKLENKMLNYEESMKVVNDLFNKYVSLVNASSGALQSGAVMYGAHGVGSRASSSRPLPNGSVNNIPNSQNYIP